VEVQKTTTVLLKIIITLNIWYEGLPLRLTSLTQILSVGEFPPASAFCLFQIQGNCRLRTVRPTREDGIFNENLFITETLFSRTQSMPSSKYLSQVWKSVFVLGEKKNEIKKPTKNLTAKRRPLLPVCAASLHFHLHVSVKNKIVKYHTLHVLYFT